MSIFDGIQFSEENKVIQKEIKDKYKELEQFINKQLPKGFRSKKKAISRLEESMMWIGKAVKDKQLVEGAQNAKKKA